MKITKLFHWLYTFLMLMPVFYILSFIITNLARGNISNINIIFDNAFTSLYTLNIYSWVSNFSVTSAITSMFTQLGVVRHYANMFSYWCGVSIVWLIFDLMMYLPLLSHRLIDKAIGGVE